MNKHLSASEYGPGNPDGIHATHRENNDRLSGMKLEDHFDNK